MTKVRKVKRRKRYQTNVNRKRLRNKLRKLPAIECKQIKEAWEVTKSTRINLSEMGLAYDPNEVLKIPNTKRELIDDMKNKNEESDGICSDDNDESAQNVPPKIHIAQDLENEAKAPRENMFRLPNGQVQFVTYMLDKYKDDYKAMARDKKNYYQLTWRQILAKIKVFKNIPQQYNEYLQNKEKSSN